MRRRALYKKLSSSPNYIFTANGNTSSADMFFGSTAGSIGSVDVISKLDSTELAVSNGTPTPSNLVASMNIISVYDTYGLQNLQNATTTNNETHLVFYTANLNNSNTTNNIGIGSINQSNSGYTIGLNLIQLPAGTEFMISGLTNYINYNGSVAKSGGTATMNFTSKYSGVNTVDITTKVINDYASNTFVQINSSSYTFSVTLPANPTSSTRYFIYKVTQNQSGISLYFVISQLG